MLSCGFLLAFATFLGALVHTASFEGLGESS
jgi:hypothetical protein